MSNGPDPKWQGILKFNFGYLKNELINNDELSLDIVYHNSEREKPQ